MKNKLITFFAAAALLVSASCKHDQYNGEYQQSYNEWMKFKTESKNSYKYTVNAGSVFGPNTETIIYVSNGVVVRRSYKATFTKAGSQPSTTVTEEWAEEKASLNLHPNGAAVINLDDVYTEAKSNWLKKRDNAKTFFETKNNGMISSAGYVENGCQDDCFIGITISAISKEIFAN